MVWIELVAGLLVGPVVAAAVYLDASREDQPEPSARRWAGLVGGLCVGGFLAARVFRAQIHLVYFQRIKSRPIATSPREVLVLQIAVGAAVSVVAVLLYVVDSRYRTPQDG